MIVGSPPRYPSTSRLDALYDWPQTENVDEGEQEYFDSPEPSIINSESLEEFVRRNMSEEDKYARQRVEIVISCEVGLNRELRKLSALDTLILKKYRHRTARPRSTRPEQPSHSRLQSWPMPPALGKIRHGLYFLPPLYSNGPLELNHRTTVDKLSEMRLYTYGVRANYLERGLILEAASLSVWLTRHRVLVIEGVPDYKTRRDIARDSFPKDVAGKWCQPYGDLLIFPGAHDNMELLKEALIDIQSAMSVVGKLRQPTHDADVTEVEPVEVTEDKLDNLTPHDITISCGLRLTELQHFTLVFKPIFTSRSYHMVFAKTRLAVELLQSAAMALMRLADWSLYCHEYGQALCYVQHLQQCVLFFYNMLPDDEDLKQYYTYTMTLWLVARCHFELYGHRHRLNELKQNYEYATEKVGILVEHLYPNKKFLRDLFPNEPSTEFPKNADECLTRAYTSFNALDVPRGFNRSSFQKEFSELLYWDQALRKWTGRYFNTTYCDPATVCRDLPTLVNIFQEVDCLRQQKTGRFDYQAMVLNLAARCAKCYMAAIACDPVMFSKTGTYHIAAGKVNKNKRKYHQYVQLKALMKFNEQFENKSSYRMRVALIQTARAALADEVILGIDVLNHQASYCTISAVDQEKTDIRSTAPIELWTKKRLLVAVLLKQPNRPNKNRSSQHSTCTVMDLLRALPKAVHLWFSFGFCVPSPEASEFDFMMAMFFYGMASNFLLLHQNDGMKNHEKNAKYMFALSCQYLKRGTVTVEVIAVFLEHALTIEYCCVIGPSLHKWNAAKRSFLILRKLVRLLPVLYELCILQGLADGPTRYEQVIIVMQHYPLPISLLEDYTVVGNRISKKLMKYVMSDIRAEAGVPFLAQTADPKCKDLKENTYEFCPVEFEGHVVVGMKELPVRKKTGKGVPVKGRNDCLYVDCPIEQYIENEESRFRDYERYNYEDLGQIHRVFSELTPDVLSNLGNLLREMKNAIKRAIDVAKVVLKTLSKEGDDIKVSTSNAALPNGTKHPHTPEFIRTELLLVALGLDDTSVFPLLGVTRALYKLDHLLNEGHVSTLLRGDLHM